MATQSVKAMRAVGKALRALPTEMQEATKAEGQRLVSKPLARDMAAISVKSKWHPKLATTIKPTGGAIPGVNVTSGRAIFSGGASTRDLSGGAAFGGKGAGKARVISRLGKVFEKRTTMQFKGPGVDYVYGPIKERGYLGALWLAVVDEALKHLGGLEGVGIDGTRRK